MRNLAYASISAKNKRIINTCIYQLPFQYGDIMDKEQLAVSAVVKSISKTDVLTPFIKTGEKEPSWDGFIYIHESKAKNKDNIKRVPVQVKGKVCNDFSNTRIKYPAEIADLNNYLNNGGCVFIVVYLSDDGEREKIYYTSLLPIKLRDFLKNTTEKQKTKAIELCEFPIDNDRKVSIFLSFHTDMEKQASFIHAPLLSFEEYQKQGLIEDVSLTFVGYGKNKNLYDCAFQNDFYPYVRVKGSPILHPVEGVTHDLHIAEDVSAVISVGGKQYYDSFRRIHTRDDVTAEIGHSCKLTISKIDQGKTISFTPTSILQYIIHDYEFILSVYDNNGIELNGEKLEIDCKAIIPKERIKSITEILEYATKLEQLFNQLRLQKNYDISKISQDERAWIARLIHGIVDQEPLKYSGKDPTSFLKVDIAGTKILIELDKVEEPDVFKIYDFFKGKAIFWFSTPDDASETHIPTSRYTVLNALDFLELGNIDYEAILLDYESFNDESNYAAQNRTLLEMLKAYDQSNDERKDILAFAEKMALSLLNRQRDENGNERPMYQLNLFQTIKRTRALTRQEQTKIYEIAEDISQDEDMRTGAYLLLDNQLAAEAHFSKLSIELQRLFRTFPIFRFWKHDNVK